MEIAANGRLQGVGGIVGDIENAGEIALDGLGLTGNVRNSGLVDGDGRIGGDLLNVGGGEVRLGEGDTLTTIGTFGNIGAVNALGATVPGADPTTLDFRGDGGNFGEMSAIGGRSVVYGALTNAAGAELPNGGAGELILFDALTNDGELATGMGSTTIVAGYYSGARGFHL